MNVLVIGGGAREHAICLALRNDPSVTTLHCAPGNAGIAAIAAVHEVDVHDPAAVAELALQLTAELVVIGPENPLVAGVVDAVQAKGIACFGPTRAAARLEGSKAFAKEIMAAADVPTAASRVCVDARQVAAALDEFGPPYVVKDDALAAGKGVVVTLERDVALEHASHCGRVVIEEYLDGPEVSLFAITDGTTVVPLIPAQDFKRLADGDHGPNTGGMGAYAPLPWAPPTLIDDMMRDVLRPTIDEMRRRGTPFAGLLYAGIALTSKGVRVVEFNARFGDPETQVVLALLKTPLASLLQAAATGTLADHPPLEWHAGFAITVVIAAKGYPGQPVNGDPIGGLDGIPAPAYVLHAGTAADASGQVVSAGGRVLSVTATGDTLEAARDAAYAGVDQITLEGAQYRSDIALLAVRGEITA
ncbi:MAG TPA: phosphoribosylamine--glycine ligase [Acidothermaceae bacterium]